MRDPLTDDERQARASVDGRVAFAAAALFLAGALVAVIDRVGAPARLVTILGPAIALGGLVVLGFLVQATRVSNFYAAGRVMPAKYVGLGMAGLALALIPPMLPPGPPGGAHAALLLGLIAGVALAAFGSGPLLRKSGAFSIADLFGARFESPALRSAGAVLIAFTCALVALAAFEGSVRGLEQYLGLARFPACLLAGFLILTIVAPGGLAGSVWAAAGAAFVLSLALLLPLAILQVSGSPLPAPLVGRADLWAEALARMALWNPPGAASAFGFFVMAAGAAIGVAALAPLLAPMVAGRSAKASSRAGAIGFLCFLVLAAAMMIALAVSALALDALAVGKRPDALPAFLYVASDKGLLTICGQHAASPRAAALLCSGVEGFSGRIGSEHLWTSGRYLASAMPELGGLSLAITGLVAAGFLSAALALTAGAVQACATALGQDLLFAGRERVALTSRRLAAARLVMAALALGLTFMTSAGPINQQNALALAMLVSAAAIAPVLLLSAWSRATAADATLAMGAGAAVAIVTVALGWREGAFHMPVMAGGALGGFLVASIAGVATSLRRKESETRPGRIFVEGLLYGDGDVMGVDRGA
ncbi:MAG: hypothetical protein K2Y29_12665 [Beijerinckiaceae bacterium]|nr:hypothetical protein [Beijerinckiaceae bacterium]